MDTVFIPKSSGHDFTPAKVFGDLRVIVPDDVSPMQVDLLREHVRKAMRDARPDDYVVMCGPPQIAMIIGELWPYDVMRVLLYIPRDRKYIDKVVSRVA